MRISRQDSIVTRIQIAGEIIAEENKRRKRYKLPKLRPSHVDVSTRPAYDRFGNKTNVTMSRKRLVGQLSKLCNVLRSEGIPIPWKPIVEPERVQ